MAIEAQGYAKLKNGKTYENLYHFLFVVRDGKIQEGKNTATSITRSKFSILNREL